MHSHQTFRSQGIGWILVFALGGCATPIDRSPEARGDFTERRARVEALLDQLGVQKDPGVEAKRDELEAAIAEEGEDLAVDSVELRTQISDGRSTDVGLRARLPIENFFELPARREARKANTDAALERLRAAGLERKAAQCLPALDHSLVSERRRIFDRYAERLSILRNWSRQLQDAGLVDEISAMRFDLSSQMRLDTRTPAERPPFPAEQVAAWTSVLPEPSDSPAPIQLDPETVRQRITQHQPQWQVERALARRYRALANAARASRMPHLKFFDLSFDPASGGNPSEVGAQVGVEIRLGRAANAREQSALAMARSHERRSRFVLEDRTHLAEAALYDLRDFELRGATWKRLLDLADRSEQIADRWQRDRLTEPHRISSLLDDVYDARIAVLAERERAGLAGCSLLAATGIPADSWRAARTHPTLGLNANATAKSHPSNRD